MFSSNHSLQDTNNTDILRETADYVCACPYSEYVPPLSSYCTLRLCITHGPGLLCSLCVCVWVEARGPPLSEHLARLLCDPDKGGSPAQLFELGSTHIGAGGAESSQHIANGIFYISPVWNFHCPPLRRPEHREAREKVRRNTSCQSVPILSLTCFIC